MSDGSSFGGNNLAYFVARPVFAVNGPASLTASHGAVKTAVEHAIANIVAQNSAATDPYFKFVVSNILVTFDGANFWAAPDTSFYGSICQPGVLITQGAAPPQPGDFMANPNNLSAVIATFPENLRVAAERDRFDPGVATGLLLTNLETLAANSVPGLVVRWLFNIYDGSHFWAVAVYAESMELLTQPPFI